VKRVAASRGWIVGALAVGLSAVSGCGDGLDLVSSLEQVPHSLIGPLIALATLTSEDLACVTAGVLASQDILTYFHAVWWCWLGILAGDMGLYWVGRIFGAGRRNSR